MTDREKILKLLNAASARGSAAQVNICKTALRLGEGSNEWGECIRVINILEMYRSLVDKWGRAEVHIVPFHSDKAICGLPATNVAEKKAYENCRLCEAMYEDPSVTWMRRRWTVTIEVEEVYTRANYAYSEVSTEAEVKAGRVTFHSKTGEELKARITGVTRKRK